MTLTACCTVVSIHEGALNVLQDLLEGRSPQRNCPPYPTLADQVELVHQLTKSLTSKQWREVADRQQRLLDWAKVRLGT